MKPKKQTIFRCNFNMIKLQVFIPVRHQNQPKTILGKFFDVKVVKEVKKNKRRKRKEKGYYRFHGQQNLLQMNQTAVVWFT